MPLDIRSLMMSQQPPKAPAIQSQPKTAMRIKPGMRMNIPDNRNVDAITGKEVSPNNRLTRIADLDTMSRIISAAKKNGVDPYTALAIGHQETGLDRMAFSEDNPFHLLDNRPDDLVDSGLKLLKEKMEYGKRLGKTSEADLIQAFNGYGKVGSHTEGRQKMMYGVDVSKTPIDMNKTPLYGRRIIDIRENILKKNPEIVKLVSETQ